MASPSRRLGKSQHPFFGWSSSFSFSLPYGVGNFKGQVADVPRNAYRSGLLDSDFRFAVNLKGGPAMSPREYAKWRQKTLIGVSMKVTAPTSQHNPAALLNFGTNRWAFRPEVGVSRLRGHWLLDTYAGVWFFTPNIQYYPGTTVQSKDRVGEFEGHLSYNVRPGSGRRSMAISGSAEPQRSTASQARRLLKKIREWVAQSPSRSTRTSP